MRPTEGFHCQTVAEVQIPLEDRRKAESKFGLREQLLFVRRGIQQNAYRLPELRRFATFAVVGASGLVIDLLCFRLLLTSLGPGVARAVAIFIAMTWNFELNRRFTFSVSRHASILAEYLRFCAACFLGACLNWTTTLTLLKSFDVCREQPVAVALVSTVLAAVLNFTLCQIWVFGRRKRVAIHVTDTAGESMQASGALSDYAVSQ